MKLLVCISVTPETSADIQFTNNGTEFDEAGVKTIMNPYDEWYALVRAIELKEENGGEVTVLHVGPAKNETVIRKALAIGADKAVRIDAEPTSAMYVANEIANYAREEQFDLIFVGKETIDYNGSEVGGMVSELLNLPFISYANHLSIDGQTVTVAREIEGGTEAVTVSMPLLISAAKGLAEQRIANMRGIMMAKRKPLDVREAKTDENPVRIVSYRLPPEKGTVHLVDPENMEELVRLLSEEAKVI